VTQLYMHFIADHTMWESWYQSHRCTELFKATSDNKIYLFRCGEERGFHSSPIPSYSLLWEKNQRSYDITVFGDTEKLSGQCPEQPELTLKLSLLWAEDWTRWHPDVSSRLVWVHNSRIACKLL